jgi:hypothetical protein
MNFKKSNSLWNWLNNVKFIEGRKPSLFYVKYLLRRPWTLLPRTPPPPNYGPFDIVCSRNI